MVAMNIINIYENYNSYFSEDLKTIFEQLSKIASKHGYKLYLIGGLVRDLLLNNKSLDIDITVEGDAIEFAHVLKNEYEAKILSIHKDFGTVKVEFNGENIDFASTRSEKYAKKGHLPQVVEIGCSLEKDVLRRDFTINSLALSLNKNNFADLLDYVNGLEDLKSKSIRILHDLSFIDDPTRIIRALKYSARLGFDVEKHTQKLQKEYLENINYDMCNKRVKQEFKKTFEDCNQSTFDRFIDEKIYKLLMHSHNPTYNTELVSAAKVEKLILKYKPKHCWLIYLGLLVLGEDIDCLELTKNEKSIIEGAKNLLEADLKNDFEIYKALNKEKLETLIILAALGKEKEISHYLDNLQKIKLQINGNDLIDLGFKSSKAFSEGFDVVLKEKLKQPSLKKTEELEIIKKFLT